MSDTTMHTHDGAGKAAAPLASFLWVLVTLALVIKVVDLFTA